MIKADLMCWQRIGVANMIKTSLVLEDREQATLEALRSNLYGGKNPSQTP